MFLLTKVLNTQPVLSISYISSGHLDFKQMCILLRNKFAKPGIMRYPPAKINLLLVVFLYHLIVEFWIFVSSNKYEAINFIFICMNYIIFLFKVKSNMVITRLPKACKQNLLFGLVVYNHTCEVACFMYACIFIILCI